MGRVPIVLLVASAMATANAVSDGRAQAQPMPQPRPALERPVETGSVAIIGLPMPRPTPPQRPVIAAVPPRPPPDPQAEAACRRTLTALGVTFAELEPINGTAQCGIGAPIAVTRLGPGLVLEPASQLNCRTAAALAAWAREAVAPAARTLLGAEPVTIVHNSTYVCRARNNVSGARISEHAFGNAVDIARIRFDGRDEFIVGVRETVDAEAAFQRRIREAACRHFKTVLGPGTDAAHATHFHFDMAPRRSGRYCR